MPTQTFTGVKGNVAISKGSLSFMSFILLVTVIKVASGFDGSGKLAVWFGSVDGLMVALKLTPNPKGSIFFKHHISLRILLLM